MASVTAAQHRGTTLRRAAWAASLTGLGTLALTAVFLLLPDSRAAVDACGGRAPSLIQFQLAFTVADVEQALGPPGACRDAATAAMETANRLDVCAYIATYGAFLLLSLFAVMSEAKSGRYRATALVILAALLADVVETTTQLAITGAMTADAVSAQDYMPFLIVASRLKFLGLGFAAVAASWAGWKARPRRPILAASCLPVIVLLPLSLAAPKSFADVAPLGTAVAWLVLLGTVVRIALKSPDGDRRQESPGA